MRLNPSSIDFQICCSFNQSLNSWMSRPTRRFLITVFLFLVYFLPYTQGHVCTNQIHTMSDISSYHFSWKVDSQKTFTWQQGRDYCRTLCMDLLSLDDGVTEWNAMKSFLIRDDIPYIWTSGRKCNFKGCDHSSLQPPITNGWFWASNKIRIPNPFASKCQHCVWSKTGPQPDNREGITAGRDEACLAVLNNVYNDGITWHDVACHHKKPVICESRRFVLKF
ncbi:uncharacterized protein [Lepeophtheirus salmonis]|uniref:uncharacterized protein isoform X2 n=1 Tax=Lepeophtheirus salmonis TaxID=72036 RepID=UPI001AE3DEF3|nr:uncharacterized protein LOC121123437 isoform X2 [Lepeophtheirus salmonis]